MAKYLCLNSKDDFFRIEIYKIVYFRGNRAIWF